MKIRGVEIKVVKADITGLKVDAIVNAANNELVMGGGVAGAIKRKGGQAIEDEAVKYAPIETGAAVATSAGSLPAKYVIHAATMGMDFKTDEIRIRNSCRSALEQAEKLKVKSVALPALGCGAGKFDLLASAKVMSQEVFRHLREERSGLKEVIFCLYDKKAYDVFSKGVLGYLEHIVQKLQKGPFSTVDAIVNINDEIILVERSNPPFGLALPGGFVDYGESLEDAIKREVKEETNLEVEEARQFHTYSDPGRDPRFHTIGTVFIVKAKGSAKAGDDAKGLKMAALNRIEDLDLAFDHKKIIRDYINSLSG